MTILLIEDDHIEVLKLNRSIAKLGQEHEVVEAGNGEEALTYLGAHKLPDLLLLDLNMPKMNGLEFLRVLRNSDRLKYLPTVVLTTSVNEKDLKEAYALGVAGYLLKPLKYEDYITKIEVILAFWKHNELVKPK